MKAGQVRDMTSDQLGDELVKLKKEQFNLRFQAASGQLENTARVRQIRRDIARIQTISRQKVADGGEAKAAPRQDQDQGCGQAEGGRQGKDEDEGLGTHDAETSAARGRGERQE